MASLLFENATALTMTDSRTRVEAVAVRDGRIAAAGSRDEAALAAGSDAARIDCAGGLLLPAFIDAHCHLLSFAASLRSVDCTDARRIADIQQAIRDAAARGGWVRAFGYEETALAEGRHPTRWELDEASGDCPVRLIHRSGHASVLNSAALRLAGIGIATEEPEGAFIDRDLPSGEPSGLLLGMEREIDRLAPAMPYAALSAAVREASERLLAAGVTCVVDATHTNGAEAWTLVERLVADGALLVDVVLMEGYEQLGELPESGAGGRILRGAVKIMIEELGGALVPDEAELTHQVGRVHRAGRQVAIHAVGAPAVSAAANAIEAALRAQPRDDHRHRIEHCSLLPEGLAPRLAALGVIVASQPAFVADRGDRYLKLVPEPERSGLYAFRSLSNAGVPVAAGSDAPVTKPQPLAAVAAAVGRVSASGRPVAPEQAVDCLAALRWWTSGSARAAFLERRLGSISVGARADLVLLPAETLTASPQRLRKLAPLGVWRRGRRVASASN